ncbi:MAG TPA: serine hydrolase domain-containing protein, partial [Terriglobales bacterium]|nr:serine hydrolase domain-containing protein [Terriglobales bacterium]
VGNSPFETLKQDSQGVPGGVVIVTAKGTVRHVEAFGHFTFAADSPPVTTATVFDLASVTKVVATTAMAMVLYDRGRVDLEQPLVEIVPEFRTDDPRREVITLRMLLAHSSGLPPHQRYFETCRSRDELLQALFTTPLKSDPMSQAGYSDLGFILLGMALERLANDSLAVFCEREIFVPLEMTRTRFNPPAEWKSIIPPTLDDDYFRHRIIQGEVNDENAYLMGGVAGHAGLFAPAEDVAKFALCMLRGGSPIIRPGTVRLFTQRQPQPVDTSRTLGWDTPSAPSQAGKHFSAASYGHLGYTGTSLWIDPQRDVSITLLTNRTWPDAKSQAIKQVRPAVHDVMMEALLTDQ